MTGWTVGMMSSSRLAPQLVEHIGTRACCVGGLLLSALGLVVLSMLDQTSRTSCS